jgi:septal ring factor EnvC (AmiA/AmiB activator)
MAKQSELDRVLAHIDAEIAQLQRAKEHILAVHAEKRARERKRGPSKPATTAPPKDAA